MTFDNLKRYGIFSTLLALCLLVASVPSVSAAPAQEGFTLLEMRVAESGFHRVTEAMLADAGVDISAYPVRDLAVTHMGEPVPIRVLAPQQQFASLEFYGESNGSLYTDTSVYYLRVERSQALRMRGVQSKPKKKAVVSPSYPGAALIHEPRDFLVASQGSPWYAHYLSAWQGSSTKVFTADAPGLVPEGEAVVHVDLSGVSAYPGLDPDHHLQIALNGELLADVWFDGYVHHPLDLDVDAALLLETGNELTITMVGDTGFEYDSIVIHSYGITYPRQYVAEADRLMFTNVGEAFAVEGFTSPGVTVYRRDDRGMSFLRQVQVTPSGGTYTAVFAGTGKESATYMVLTSEAFLTPELVAPLELEDISSGTAQLLIISNPLFLEGLGGLVARREADGYSVQAVGTDQVYAQYGHGHFGAEAIREYIRFAVEEKGTEYVLLVGGDTHDYLGYTDGEKESMIPSLYVETSDQVFHAPSDAALADVDGDGVPDVSIGRFPVHTLEQLEGMVYKTLSYGAKDYGGTAVFAAGIGREGQSDDRIALLDPSWVVTQTYIADLGVPAARNLMVSAIENGVALVHFDGQSGPSHWEGGLSSRSRAAALENPGKPTVVVQWGKWNSFHTLQSDTIGEAFLVNGDRGAAAVLGSVSVVDPDHESVYGDALASLLTEPGMTIGMAIRLAKEEVAAVHPDWMDVLYGRILLGDPTAVVVP